MQGLNQPLARPLQKPLATGPPTRKDGARADDKIALRKLLLRAPEVRARFDQLASLMPAGHVSTWPRHAGRKCYDQLERTERDLDYAWTLGELERLAKRWATPDHYGTESYLPYRDRQRRRDRHRRLRRRAPRLRNRPPVAHGPGCHCDGRAIDCSPRSRSPMGTRRRDCGRRVLRDGERGRRLSHEAP
jgi:hypothetical protein